MSSTLTSIQDISCPRKGQEIILRPYQERDLEHVRAAMREHRSVLLVQPTGAGKSVLVARVVAGAVSKNKRTLFLVNRRELVKQMARRIELAGIDHGIIMAGSKAQDAPVQIASIDALNRRKSYPDADLVIVDEAHFALSPVFAETLKRYSDAKILCATATPIRADGRGLGEICEAMVGGPSVQELIDGGYLVPSRVFAPYVPDTSGVDDVGGEFNQRQLAAVMDKPKLVGDIVSTWKHRANGLKTVVFAVHKAHARNLADQFRLHNVSAEVVLDDTTDDERQRIWDAFDHGDLAVIVSVGVISYGWDHPIVRCVVLARPTLSLAMHLQQIGRGSRPYPGKNFLLVLDHAGNTHHHGFYEEPRQWSLDGIRLRPKGEYCPSVSICRVCLAAFRSGLERCPYCNSVAIACPRKIQVEQGQLEELQRQRKAEAVERWAANATKDTMRDKYREWLVVAKSKGYRPTWAAVRCHHTFGVWPPKWWGADV